jgi:ribonuclease PH
MRSENRGPHDLRTLKFKRRYTRQAPGSVLVQMGRTTVVCTCCLEQAVPPFLEGSGRGWLTAEYGMLPGSTSSRKPRDRGGKVDGRTVEIQRLIGRGLRAIVNLEKLGEHTLWLDCDVLEADGGTRTASINGSFVALVDALHANRGVLGPPELLIKDSVAAVSVGTVNNKELLDLDYSEDKEASVDLNLIMTGSGEFVEVQGAGEEATFTRQQFDRLLKLGKMGIEVITRAQKRCLGANWPLD